MAQRAERAAARSRVQAATLHRVTLRSWLGLRPARGNQKRRQHDHRQQAAHTQSSTEAALPEPVLTVTSDLTTTRSHFFVAGGGGDVTSNIIGTPAPCMST